MSESQLQNHGSSEAKEGLPKDAPWQDELERRVRGLAIRFDSTGGGDEVGLLDIIGAFSSRIHCRASNPRSTMLMLV